METTSFTQGKRPWSGTTSSPSQPTELAAKTLQRMHAPSESIGTDLNAFDDCTVLSALLNKGRLYK